VAAIRMLAEVGARLGRFEDAERLLARCLELAPSFVAARHNYALVLHRQSKAAEALEQIDQLLAVDQDNPSYRFLKAAALARVGEYGASIAIYEGVLRQHPQSARGWLSLGHARKTAGQRAESIAAYAKCVEIAPNFGEAYWSLANMKTYRFGAAQVAAMQAQVERADISDEDRFHLRYALGKAFEDEGDYAGSFRHYAEGARLRRATLGYDADETTAMARRHAAFFTKELFAARAGQGAPAADPIFIVGLPRSGSTLIEQILASHSAVEGTMELPDLMLLAKRIGGGRSRGGAYPEALAGLAPQQLRELGEEYLARTRVQRKTGKPYFIDKMPNNFQHAGFIQLILPNAKIIDARRQPLACCFSAFKQHFARGQPFTYDLAELGRYCADYVALMDHFDRVLPGRIHRVRYEALVADPEPEIRRMLDYCGLPFEPACLEFHANTRAVRTASSEQVRQPLYSEAIDHWRHYEPWLGPLKAALGPVRHT
jgi:cytochrome c-type biogenesis protein CcmH/NrfG